MSGTKKDIFALSDEEIMSMSGPGETSAQADAQNPPETQEDEPEDPAPEPEAPEAPEADPKPEEKQDPEPDPADPTDPKDPEPAPEPGADPLGSNPKAEKPEKAEAKPEDKPQEKPGDKPESQAPDYEGFYKKIVETPFKANGKMIEIRTPEEAISLMQMGANYTRKLQELAPVRKIVTMLEKNQLLDEEKLGFLIDIQNKNPDAIKKLVSDSGIDPIDIDVNAESNYKAGNHRVTDAEVKFRTAMGELSSHEDGKKTLQTITADWDDASKDILWEQPEIFAVIHEQRTNGAYDRIATEVNRQKTLGTLQADMPFILAYKKVGDEMVAASQPQNPGGPGTPPKPAVVATQRPAPVKPVVKSNDKAQAASGTRSTNKPAKAVINPLAMSDEDFLKQFANRL